MFYQNTKLNLDYSDFLLTVTPEELFDSASDSPFRTAALYPFFGNLSTEYAIRHEKVQDLIHSDNLHFDLVINHEIFHDVFLAFGYKFNAPIVTICPYGIADFMDHDMGLLTPISHVSHVMLSYTDNMNFAQRWYNTMLTIYDWILREWHHFPMQNKILQQHFGHLESVPSVEKLRQNISIIFVNAHRSITHPRPSMPGLVYIGGAHIQPPKALPADLQQFLDESEHGVVYFSLGTVVNASRMPKEKLAIFLSTI